jgi:hypothetical protein
MYARTEYAGYDEALDEERAHVSEPVVRDSGNARRRHLGRVNAGAGDRRRHAERQQKRCGADAVCHAQGAIDQLRQKPDDHERGELVQAAPFRLGLPILRSTESAPVYGKTRRERTLP